MKIIAYTADADILHPACCKLLYGDETHDSEGNEIAPVFEINFEDWHFQEPAHKNKHYAGFTTAWSGMEWVEMGCGYCLNLLSEGPNFCTCGVIDSRVSTRNGCRHLSDH